MMDRVFTGRGQVQALLPLNRKTVSSSFSFWYFDLKIFYLNEPLFRFGRKHARLLKMWFSVGVGFTLATLFALHLFLVWEVSSTLRGMSGFGNLLKAVFPGIPSQATGFSFSRAIYLCVSSVLSIFVHELGHIISSASEGVRMDYFAFFIAVGCPGALVAFNHDALQLLPRFGLLRIYSAGVWHNAAWCVVCGMTLLGLPFILLPLYRHGENIMVVDVSEASPLLGYVSRGNIILSVDGFPIRNLHDWRERTTYLTGSGKGYCVPISVLAQSRTAPCPEELAAFAEPPHDGDVAFCLDPGDVVKLSKCNSSTFVCVQDEAVCVMPVLFNGTSWAEIEFGDRGCLSSSCGGGTFVFIGEMRMATSSITLTEYQPRHLPGSAAVYFPHLLEAILIDTYTVSLLLGIVNCLPVYCLDGESILETTLCYLPFVRRRGMRRLCLLVASLLSLFVALRTCIRFYYFII